MGTPPELTNWDPLSPNDVAEELRDYQGLWCIAGGWATDLFADMQSRPHADIDVVVDRADLPIIHRSLPGWLLYAARGNVALWEDGTAFPKVVHDIWCRRPGRPWEMQLMVNDFTESEWIFRRDDRVRGPRADMIVISPSGLPIMAPEIQLLYKSLLSSRPKNEHDFANALPHLSLPQRQWLRDQLNLLYGDHPWLRATLGIRSRLRGPTVTRCRSDSRPEYRCLAEESLH